MASEWQVIYREAGYGLGLAKHRTQCGTWVWFHGGVSWGVASVNAASADGRTSVEIVLASEPSYPEAKKAQLTRCLKLTDRALCAHR
ncbi:hypothetical protein E1264_04070 [Actinomadura sp. KC216]|uniref:hypothetical protein n=1 Tax=Actinomadura sp. KC216 TaxID=2530370 RepID=UPI00104EFD3B|nr:hypothetical protein [Actinomadura sp. KC216]TDB90792.1 hypothetical protein E1264_04070 [Actinomadura sp. KC216]